MFFRRNKRPSIDTITQSVDRLIEMGFLKFAPDSDHLAARQELIESLTYNYIDTEWDDNCNSRDRRQYRADNEDLAEGDIGQSLLVLRDVLSHEGVHLDSVEDDFGDAGYAVIVNGRRHQIYFCDKETWSSINIWGIALKRYLEIVNELLTDARSAERAYGIYGGNDGRIILLTEEMHCFLKSMPVKLEGTIFPYPPACISDEGKWLGQDRT